MLKKLWVIAALAMPLLAGAQANERSLDVLKAAAQGNAGQVRAALANGGSANVADAQGKSALYYAVRANSADAAAALLEAGAAGINGLYVFRSGAKESTMGLLEFAVANRNREMVKTLLKRGADVNLLNPHSENPLPMAVFIGDVEIIRMLLEAGVDPNRRLKSGSSAAGLALFKRNTEAFMLLLDAKANVDLRDHYGGTLTMLAVDMGNVDAVQRLIERGAPLYPLDVVGQTALARARQIKNAEQRDRLIAMLEAAGATDGKQARPIDQEFLQAAHRGDVQKAAALLARGADLHVRGRVGEYPVYTNALAVAVRYPKLCRFLLDKGINPHMRSSYDFTALHTAARDGSPQVIEMLLEKGADPNARSRSGMSPLYMAINGNPKMANVAALLKAGADPDGPTPKKGESLIAFARAKQMMKVVEMLEAAKTIPAR